MEKKSVLSTLRFIFLTVIILVLVFSAVAITVMNMYKSTLKVSINGTFIGYFSNRQQFDEVYTTLVAEKQQADANAKVYLDNDPVFETSYIRDVLLSTQNVYTNLRAAVKTEYTIYKVMVNNENKMTFNVEDEANKYADNLKKQVSKLNVQVTSEKKSELVEMTTIERADSILSDIVSRNKPITPTKTNTRTYTATNAKASAQIANVAAAQGGIWPTSSRLITSPYGWRYDGFHTGTDIAGRSGDPIYAYKSGLVTFAGWNAGGYGYLVKIDHGNGVSSWYAHCSRILVSAGDTVNQGQVIAKMGTTGYSSGNHLHFEIRIGGSTVNSYLYIAGK
jgi:murein DD-endopeptidase MepM/ murein hydrolase activator NlpD